MNEKINQNFIETFDVSNNNGFPEAKYTRISEKLLQAIPGALQCSVSCGGRNCKWENPQRWPEKDQVIEGVYSSWVLDNVVAMSRPSTEVIIKYKMIEQFKQHNITSIINLQRPGEHASCGPPLCKESLFTYEPKTFMDADIFFYNFGWKDFGVASLGTILDMVKVMTFALEDGKVAVHCHAGLGRTGVLIACYLVYSHRMDAASAITTVRKHRTNAIQTRSQLECVKQFAQFLKPLRIIFPQVVPWSQRITLHQFLRRQSHLLHGMEARELKLIPKLIMVICQRLTQIATTSELSKPRKRASTGVYRNKNKDAGIKRCHTIDFIKYTMPGAFVNEHLLSGDFEAFSKNIDAILSPRITRRKSQSEAELKSTIDRAALLHDDELTAKLYAIKSMPAMAQNENDVEENDDMEISLNEFVELNDSSKTDGSLKPSLHKDTELFNNKTNNNDETVSDNLSQLNLPVPNVNNNNVVLNTESINGRANSMQNLTTLEPKIEANLKAASIHNLGENELNNQATNQHTDIVSNNSVSWANVIKNVASNDIHVEENNINMINDSGEEAITMDVESESYGVDDKITNGINEGAPTCIVSSNNENEISYDNPEHDVELIEIPDDTVNKHEKSSSKRSQVIWISDELNEGQEVENSKEEVAVKREESGLMYRGEINQQIMETNDALEIDDEEDDEPIMIEVTPADVDEEHEEAVKPAAIRNLTQSMVDLRHYEKDNNESEVTATCASNSSDDLYAASSSTCSSAKHRIKDPITVAMALAYKLTDDEWLWEKLYSKQVEINTRESAVSDLETESDAHLLSCLMWSWLEHLARPLLDAADVEEIINGEKSLADAIRSIDKATSATVDCILNCLISLPHLTIELETSVLQRIVKACTQTHADDENYVKLIQLVGEYVNEKRGTQIDVKAEE